ncbi:hypothetical protein WJ89_03825 [Burkholderia ubonensis]|nr:hypothetical protein WJ89_03825 [Burkholderia ubonensis]KVQ86239.1 hypothetical protein WK06_05020 [Burkholderia ubonensis]KVR11288.1 hypothetical protein WK12_15775 [Burkholderia ubonensis]KWD30002.1 hypothetical protein WL63_26140 [Burkholderia ubonensis]KWD31284.1 hypothetical protein WL64_27745 [Burkholderia ubonensis]
MHFAVPRDGFLQPAHVSRKLPDCLIWRSSPFQFEDDKSTVSVSCKHVDASDGRLEFNAFGTAGRIDVERQTFAVDWYRLDVIRDEVL